MGEVSFWCKLVILPTFFFILPTEFMVVTFIFTQLCFSSLYKCNLTYAIENLPSSEGTPSFTGVHQSF